jgi:hypothetical protein
LVNETHTARMTTPQSSVTQVIADGLNGVLAKPALLAIPLLIDLYYLLGRRITLEPLLERLGNRVASRDRGGADRIGDWIGDAGGMDALGSIAILVPSFLGGVNREGLYKPVTNGPVEIGNWPVAIIAVIASVWLAAALYAGFGLWLADTIIDRRRSWSERLRAVPKVSLRIVGLAGLILGMMALLVLPLGMLWGLSSIAGIDMGGFFLSLAALVIVVLVVLFYFAPEALLVADVSPPDAMRLSVRIVRNHLWPSVSLALASMLISVGLNEIWELMAVNLPGMLLAIGGSALVGTSLALAAMLFFYQRWLAVEAEPATTR